MYHLVQFQLAIPVPGAEAARERRGFERGLPAGDVIAPD
jgi:hypothetical protein